jgi:hypothetical protein
MTRNTKSCGSGGVIKTIKTARVRISCGSLISTRHLFVKKETHASFLIWVYVTVKTAEALSKVERSHLAKERPNNSKTLGSWRASASSIH